MRRSTLIWIVTPLTAVVGLTLATAWAAPPGDAVAAPGAPHAGKDVKADKEPPKRFKDVGDVTEDMESIDGLFTLYRYKRSDKNRDPEALLAKIPAKLLDEDLLFATSLSSGGPYTGYMWNDYLIRWEVVGKYLKLVTPDVRYVQDQDEPISDVIKRTHTPRYIAAVPIEAMTSGGDVVIDLNALLKSNIADVSFLGGNVRSDLSTWSKVKNFPDNILLEAQLALQHGSGGSTVGVSYAFRRLPKLGSFKPRTADSRVGYFLTARMDWSKPTNERDTFDRYINRWKLEKRDAELELSPPKEPIVFIIEDTVPVKWRRWVREGIEDWNRAFEKIGFDQAIVVHQQTKDNEYSNYDPEDARYNFFRWIVSGRAFAMGPSRVDPRTGQVLDADIIFDDSMVRGWMQDFDMFAPSAMTAFYGPGFADWLDEQADVVPDFLKSAIEHERATAPPDQLLWDRVNAHMHEQGRCTCGFAAGMMQQVAFGRQALIATGLGDKKIPERFIGEVIKHIVTHEVGHTLGLRHNFKGSSWLSLEEIRRRRLETDEPTTASVMDYTPVMFFADDEMEKVRHFTSPQLGPYDHWAIEYGYAVAKGGKDDELLKEITSRCAERALQYNTDEDTSWVYSPDPLTNRWDHSADPMDWARSRVELADKLLANIEEWALQDGEPYHHLTRAFIVLAWERSSYFQYVGRLIGGQYFHRYVKGDPDAQPPLVLVDPQLQRDALNYLGETIFNEAFFDFDPDLLNKLPTSRWQHWGNRVESRIDFPIHDRLRWMQLFALLNITAPPVLQRIYDAELKSDADDKFTTVELLQTLRDQIWVQLDKVKGPYTDAQPFLSSIARNLQREHLNIMLLQAQARPHTTMSADIQSLIRYSLFELSERIGAVLDGNTKIDFASRAHLVECKSRIDRTLEAKFDAR